MVLTCHLESVSVIFATFIEFFFTLYSYLDIDVSWVLDSKKPRSPRLFFLSEEGKNIRNSSMHLNRGKTECRTERVYIADNIRDKLTPLEVEMRFKMKENHQITQQRVKRGALDPIVDQNRGTVERDAINIQKNCGPDNVCIPDLRLDVKSVDTYLLGSKDLLIFDVKVSNFGEDAFEAGFFMGVPEGMTFRKIERIGDSRDTPVTCTAPSSATNNSLKCDIGNPLSSGKVASFKIILLPATKQGLAPKYDFYMVANSTNAEVDGTDFDNVFKKTVGISVETNLSVKGKSIDQEILFNTTDYVPLENATREEQIGPQVVHIYEVHNGGPSTIEKAEVYFLWPHETISGDSLLYLLNQPETTRNVECELTDYANTRNLKLDQSLVTKSYLISQGAMEKSSVHSEGGRYGYTSSQSNTGLAVGGGKTQYTEEEKRHFDEEENRESSGDASYIHRQRAQQAAQEQGSNGGNYQHSEFSSWKQDGAPVSTYSASRNRSTHQGNDGRLYVTEHSTENYGNALNSQQRQHQNFQPRANINHAGAFATNNAQNVRKIEDFSAEGSVNQELTRGQSQGIQSSQAAKSSFNELSSSTGATGRRRMLSKQDGQPQRPGLITGVSPYEKNNNFQSGTYELNTLGRDNVDEEIKQHGNAAHLAAESERRQNAASSSMQHSQSNSYSSGGSSGGLQSHQSSSKFHG